MEPLGQELYTSDPEIFSPPGPDLSLRSADDPEWQCSAPHSFWGGPNVSFGDLPTHCQQRLIEDLSFPLADAKKEKKESPAKLLDSPIRRFGIGNSAAETVMAFARTSSAKLKDPDSSGCPPGYEVKMDHKGRSTCIEIITESLDVPATGFEEQDDISTVVENEWSLRTSKRNDEETVKGKELDEMVHCSPEFKKRLNELKSRWNNTRMDRNSNRIGTEAAFSVHRVNGAIVVSPITISQEAMSVTYGINPETVIATVHSHAFEKFPSGSYSNRSTLDISKAVRYDFITYVYGPAGLTLFNPRNPLDSDGKDRKVVAPKCP